MFRRIRSSVPAMALAIALLASSAYAAGEVGTPAADFDLQVLGGGTETLSQHEGEVVVLFMLGYG